MQEIQEQKMTVQDYVNQHTTELMTGEIENPEIPEGNWEDDFAYDESIDNELAFN